LDHTSLDLRRPQARLEDRMESALGVEEPALRVFRSLAYGFPLAVLAEPIRLRSGHRPTPDPIKTPATKAKQQPPTTIHHCAPVITYSQIKGASPGNPRRAGE